MSDAADLYLVWSHDHSRWWGPNERGYVRRLSEAGRYSRDAALRVCANAIPGDAARHGALQELPVRLTDVLTMQAAFRARFPGLPTEPWE